MTQNEIEEIEARLTAATKGPWKFYLEGRDHESGDSFIMTGISEEENIWSEHRGADIYLTGATNADCDFIANDRQDVPKLLQELNRLRNMLGPLFDSENSNE